MQAALQQSAGAQSLRIRCLRFASSAGGVDSIDGLAAWLEVGVLDADRGRSSQQSTETGYARLNDHDLLSTATTRLTPGAIGRHRHDLKLLEGRPPGYQLSGNITLLCRRSMVNWVPGAGRIVAS
jgi:hypothetical protein